MRLSDAIILGDTLRTRTPWQYIGKTKTGYCGCALGGASLAAGKTDKRAHLMLWPWLNNQNRDNTVHRNQEDWPHDAEIGSRFHQVCAGEITIEELAAYVKTIEPAEDVQTTEVHNTVSEEVFA